ncbi:MAG: D-galactosamine 6-phosphate deaminase/isomerase [Microbacteriaceae bacterium]|nr:D-galactosamine 6-phosphate deaminase/isomerase [Microbacteriaceae bacterium]
MTDTRTTPDGRPLIPGAEATIREISQQPEVWRETAAIVERQRLDIDGFLAPLLARDDLRIVLTGAGTSAFAGGVAAPALARLLGRRFDAVATTDIVSNPRDQFAEDVPTLLVSFARSGNSPESVAATRLADEVLTEVRHLVITCDPAGRLCREHQDRTESLVVLMTARSNDEGFAMTSSFTSMLLATLLIFGGENPAAVEALATAGRSVLTEHWDRLERLALEDYERIVYLGSGPLAALAREAALKLLELTAGAVVSYHDSPLGFRHGPKAVLDENTLVVTFVSSDPYTRNYDLDMLGELRALSPERVLAVGTGSLEEGAAVVLDGIEDLGDAFLAVAYIVVAQILALSFALRAGTTPDNPFPGGTVNRVVKGVEIHPLDERPLEQPRR